MWKSQRWRFFETCAGVWGKLLGTWGFVLPQEWGTQNWLWRKKLTYNLETKQLHFFYSKLHEITRLNTKHKPATVMLNTPPRCLPLASKDIFLISLACHHFSRYWVGSLEVWWLVLVIFCTIPWGGRSEGRGGWPWEVGDYDDGDVNPRNRSWQTSRFSSWDPRAPKHV